VIDKQVEARDWRARKKNETSKAKTTQQEASKTMLKVGSYNLSDCICEAKNSRARKGTKLRAIFYHHHRDGFGII
jgi:hypothetical protein